MCSVTCVSCARVLYTKQNLPLTSLLTLLPPRGGGANMNSTLVVLGNLLSAD